MDKTLVVTEESAGSVIRRCFVWKVVWKIAENSQEDTCAGVFFNEISSIDTCNAVKKWLPQRCFHVNFAKF